MKNRTWSQFYDGLVDVMGERFSLNWFLPIEGPELKKYTWEVLNQMHTPYNYSAPFVYSDDEDDKLFANADMTDLPEVNEMKPLKRKIVKKVNRAKED